MSSNGIEITILDTHNSIAINEDLTTVTINPVETKVEVSGISIASSNATGIGTAHNASSFLNQTNGNTVQRSLDSLALQTFNFSADGGLGNPDFKTQTETMRFTGGTGITTEVKAQDNPEVFFSLTNIFGSNFSLNNPAKTLSLSINQQGQITAGTLVDIEISESQITGLTARIDAVNSRVTAAEAMNARLTAIEAVNSRVTSAEAMNARLTSLEAVNARVTSLESASDDVLEGRVNSISTAVVAINSRVTAAEAMNARLVAIESINSRVTANESMNARLVAIESINSRVTANKSTADAALPKVGGTITGNLTVDGNLTIGGTETKLQTETVVVEDNILQLNYTAGDTATAATSGITVYRGVGVTEASFIFDEADDTWDLTNNLYVEGTLSGTTISSLCSAITLNKAMNARLTAIEAVNARVTAAESMNARLVSIEAINGRVTAAEAMNARLVAIESINSRVTAIEAINGRVTAAEAMNSRLVAIESINSRVTAIEAINGRVTAAEAMNSRLVAIESINSRVTAIEAINGRVTAAEAMNSRLVAIESINSRVTAIEAINGRVTAAEAMNSRLVAIESINSRVTANESMNARLVAIESINSRVTANESMNTRLVAIESINSRVTANESMNTRLVAIESINSRVTANDAKTSYTNAAVQTFLAGGTASASFTSATVGSFSTDADVFFAVRGQGGAGNPHYSGVQLKHGDNNFGFTIQSQDGVDTGSGSGNVFGLNILRHDDTTSYGGGQSAIFINRLDRGIGFGTDTPKAMLHIKSVSALTNSVLIEHNSGNTGWNVRAENDADDSLKIAYNSATGNNYTAQTVSTALTVKKTGDIVARGDVEAASHSLGNWEISVSSNNLVFKYNGSNVASLSTTGDLVVENNITAFGDA